MVLATPAPHTPYTPEPKYRGKYKGIKVPRTPNFNTHKLKVSIYIDKKKTDSNSIQKFSEFEQFI